MLVLSRRTGESVVITLPDGNEISLMVSQILRNNSVKLGITAPKNIQVDRKEVKDKKRLEANPAFDPIRKPS